MARATATKSEIARRRSSCPTPRASCTRCRRRARRRRPSSSGPATTAPTRSPGTTGWSTSPATTRERGVRFLAVNSNDAERYPRRLARGDARAGRARGLAVSLSPRREPGGRARVGRPGDAARVRPRRRPAAPLRGRPRRRPHGPGAGRGWLREALDALLAGDEPPASDRAGRLLDQVEASERPAPMTARRRLVRVPASSANLGPGYDVLAAALSLHLELEVAEAGEFSVDAGGRPVPARPHEPLRARLRAPAPGRRPAVRDPQRDPARPRPRLERRGDRRRADRRRPPLRARRSSATSSTPARPSSRATPTTSPPRSTAASCSARRRRAASGAAPVRLDPPEGVEAVLVIPDEEVPTEQARAAMPGRGAARRRGRQRRRRGAARARDRALRPRPDRAAGSPTASTSRVAAHLYPRSMELLAEAARAGRDRRDDLGRRPDGAGLVLLAGHRQGRRRRLRERAGGWAEVRRVPFSPLGADVPEL